MNGFAVFVAVIAVLYGTYVSTRDKSKEKSLNDDVFQVGFLNVLITYLTKSRTLSRRSRNQAMRILKVPL